MLKVLTIADKILILLVVAMSVSSFFLIAALGPEGSVVTVEVNGNVVYRTDLRGASRFSVQGARGELQLEVKDGSIRVVSADCPNKICVRTGSRQRSGEIIVCVPNKTIVRIGMGHGETIDAVTG